MDNARYRQFDDLWTPSDGGFWDLISHNGGYGYTFDSSKLGKIELFYQNPNAKGGLGGTFFSFKGLFGKFGIDWDP